VITITATRLLPSTETASTHDNQQPTGAFTVLIDAKIIMANCGRSYATKTDTTRSLKIVKTSKTRITR
jgi:hypothetical protein